MKFCTPLENDLLNNLTMIEYRQHLHIFYHNKVMQASEAMNSTLLRENKQN